MHLASATIDDLVHIAQSKLDDTARGSMSFGSSPAAGGSADILVTELLLKRADAGLYITRVGPHVIVRLLRVEAGIK